MTNASLASEPARHCLAVRGHLRRRLRDRAAGLSLARARRGHDDRAVAPFRAVADDGLDRTVPVSRRGDYSWRSTGSSARKGHPMKRALSIRGFAKGAGTIVLCLVALDLVATVVTLAFGVEFL